MITNPQVGQRVRGKDTASMQRGSQAFIGQSGTISIVFNYINPIVVQVIFDQPISGYKDWNISIECLERLDLSPEELDQQRRLEYAMKYL